LKHFLLMALFAAVVAIPFGVVGREGAQNKLRYGLKVFAEFLGVGLGLAWLLYWIP
jgi:hypothetical protein